MSRDTTCSAVVFKKENNEFKVDRVPYSEVKEWILYKHYAHRIPPIVHSFGLFRDGVLEGVVTFGPPASHDLIVGAMGEEYTFKFLELNRLVVNDGLPKNALSYFVSQALARLPRPLAIISYADSGMGHHGYIYQATNWVYTGLSNPAVDYLPENNTGAHPRTITQQSVEELRKKTRLVRKERSRKYRYFKFLGDKREVRKMMRDLKFPVVKDYPKGDNRRYDASYETHPNGLLFEP